MNLFYNSGNWLPLPACSSDVWISSLNGSFGSSLSTSGVSLGSASDDSSSGSGDDSRCLYTIDDLSLPFLVDFSDGLLPGSGLGDGLGSSGSSSLDNS